MRARAQGERVAVCHRSSVVHRRAGARRQAPTESIGVGVVNGALALAGALGANRLKERYRSTTNAALAAALVRLALDPAARDLTVASEDLR